MKKTILLTGATAGIGRETATALTDQGHHLLLHGRNASKLEALESELAGRPGAGPIETYVADLSRPSDVKALADAVNAQHQRLDVLINNAGVFKVRDARTAEGLDVRFVVNTLAPVALTRALRSRMGADARVINLSSAAQNPVDLSALAGTGQLGDFEAYAQSKLALTMWSCQLGRDLGADGPVVIAVNPGSMLGTNMVKEAFGASGKDIGIGVRALLHTALDDAAAAATGSYFDQDRGDFGPPHPDALDDPKCRAVVKAIDALLP